MVLCSVAVGIIDAAVLAVVVQVAVAMTSGSSIAGLDTGPFQLEASIPTLLLAAGALMVAQIAAQVVLSWGPARISARAQLTIRRRIARAFAETSWEAKAAEREGGVQEVLTNYVDLAVQSLLMLVVSISSLASLSALVLSSFLVDPLAAAAVIAAGALIFVMLLPLTLRMRRAARLFANRRMDLAESVSETVALAEDTHANGVASAQVDRLDVAMREITGPIFRLRLLARGVPAAYQSLVLALMVAGLGVLHLLDISSIAGLGAIVVMLLRGLNYGQKFQTAYTRWSEQSNFLQRIEDRVAHWRANLETFGIRHLPAVRTVELVHVDFAYPSRPARVLHDVSLTTRQGEVLGIVGPSGSGKSTLLKLMLALHPPERGMHLVNGRPAQEYSQSLRAAIGYVPQQGRLFTGTIEENIRFLRQVSHEEIVEAARAANIHDDICGWEDQYDTVVSPRSSALSGGQIQRLVLARALARHPSLLLLDEPTSALDADSEELIQTTIARIRARGDSTVVIVAHRGATLRHCDRIAVVQDGRLEAVGAPEVLQRTNGFLRQLVTAASQQDPWAEPRTIPSVR